MTPDPAQYVLYYRAIVGGKTAWIRGGLYSTSREAHETGTAWKVAVLLQNGHATKPAFKVVRVLK